MVTQILKEIRVRLEGETRKPATLYKELYGIAGHMMLMGTLTKDEVVKFCSNMISMYEQQSKISS